MNSMPDRRAQYAFSERLNAARKRAGLTQIEVARRSGINVGTINRYMVGGVIPGPEKRQALADAVGVDVDELWEER